MALVGGKIQIRTIYHLQKTSYFFSFLKSYPQFSEYSFPWQGIDRSLCGQLFLSIKKKDLFST